MSHSNKLILALLLLFLFSGTKAQEIFTYEKEINGRENYLSEEINFKIKDKKDSITLSGTLIKPKAAFDKVVVIVPGSGADTRHSHYRLTEELLKNNIAVYRYDEKGIGKSGGTYNKANYTISQMSDELLSCLKALRKNETLRGKKFGMAGHSQGGMVTMDAYVKGAAADFMVQWATPVQKHGEFLKYQIASGQNAFNDVLKYNDKVKKLEVMGLFHKIVADNPDDDNWALSKKLNKASKKIGYGKDNYDRFPYLTLASEKDIVRKNFEEAYKSIAIPVLYIIGTKDTFVDPDAEISLLESFGNKNISIVKMDGLNHYLTAGQLKLETFYEIDKNALNEITQWIGSK